MNLASQSVLEGLNSCLDHRGQVYIPELDRTFPKHPDFRVFAAQNPQAQGGGRKGLPQSFLNRFTKVHVEELTASDLLSVGRQLGFGVKDSVLQQLVAFNSALSRSTRHGSIGRNGGPWEFNLRDILRWLYIQKSIHVNLTESDVARLLYVTRFRTVEDRLNAAEIFEEAFGLALDPGRLPSIHLSSDALVLEGNVFPRVSLTDEPVPPALLQQQTQSLESLSVCIAMGWLSVLNGDSFSGKTAAIELLGKFYGQSLEIIRLSSVSDASDLLGSFEQLDATSMLQRHAEQLVKRLKQNISNMGSSTAHQDSLSLHQLLSDLQSAVHGQGSRQVLQILVSLRTEALTPSDDQFCVIRAACELRRQAQIAHDKEASDTAKFVWVDGPLVRSLREGHWVVLQDANCCPPAVLDRLNSLFEAEPLLVLTEKGSMDGENEVIRPHPNFRLFMTSNPNGGELSRAMRNRGIEISHLTPAVGSSSQDEDTSRMGWATRDQNPTLRKSASTAVGQSDVWAFTRPHLDHATSRPWFIASKLLRPSHNDSAKFLPYKQAVSASLGLGAVSHMSAAISIKLSLDNLIRSALLSLDGNTGFPAKTSMVSHCVLVLLNRTQVTHNITQQIRNSLQWPERSRTNAAQHESGSVRIQLSDRARLVHIYLQQVDRDAADGTQPSYLQKALTVRGALKLNEHRANIVQVLQALFRDPVDEPSQNLPLWAELQNLGFYLLELSLDEDFDHAVAYSLLDQLARSLARGANLTTALAEVRHQLLAYTKAATPRSGVALDLLWEELLMCDVSGLQYALQNAALAMGRIRSADAIKGESG